MSRIRQKIKHPILLKWIILGLTLFTCPSQAFLWKYKFLGPKTVRISFNDEHLVWAKMRKNFLIHKELEEQHPLVKLTASYYAHPRQNLHKLTSMAGPYLYYVLEQVELFEVPSELALIPLVESGFNANATSIKGAAGYWQFIASTGKRYGLTINKQFDGRRDLKLSTQAALRYLKYLYQRFDQDWMLAIAAYNAGEGTVSRAIRLNLRENKSIVVWDLKLPRQTREYLAKILALAKLVARPDLHQAKLGRILDSPYLGEIHCKTAKDFKSLAQLTGMTAKDLYRFNQGHRNLKLANLKGFKVVLPLSQVEIYQLQLAKLADRPITKSRTRKV